MARSIIRRAPRWWRALKFILVVTAAPRGIQEAHAEDFVWKAPVSGSFDDKSRWLMNQGGVSVDAPRVPNAGDTVSTRDGAYDIFISGQSAGSFYAASDNTLNISGGFTVGDFTGSPFIVGGGTLSASSWNLSPSNPTFPHAVINTGTVMTGALHLPGSALGLEIRNAGTLECTSYVHGSGFGRKPIWVTGTGSHFTVTSDITSAPQLEIHLDDGGGATLAGVSGGPEFYLKGTASVLHTGALTTSRLMIADATAITTGPATLTGFNNAISGTGRWVVNGKLSARGISGQLLTLTDEAALTANELEMDDRARIEVGTELETDAPTLTVSGALIKKAATFKGGGAYIKCGSAEFLAGEASLGEMSVDLTACFLRVDSSLVLDSSARMVSGTIVAKTCVLGRDANQRGTLAATTIFNRLEFSDSLTIGGLGRGTLTLEGKHSAVETKELVLAEGVLAEGAKSTGYLRVRSTGDLPLDAHTVVGKRGDGTMEVGEGTTLRLGPQSGAIVLGEEVGSVGRFLVSGAGAEVRQKLLDPGSFIAGLRGQGDFTVSNGGFVHIHDLWVGQSLLNNTVSVFGPLPEGSFRNLNVAGELVLGDGGQGSMTVGGGGSAAAGTVRVGKNSTEDNRLTVNQGCIFDARYSCIVGDRGSGRMVVSGSVESGGDFLVGGTPNSTGYVEISGSQAKLTALDRGRITLGGGAPASATMVLSLGGAVRTPFLAMTPPPGGEATLTVSGAGSDLLVTDRMEIGRLHRSAGPAACTISGGAIASVIRDLRVGKTGLLDVSGGMMMVGSTLPPPIGVLRVGVGGFAGIAGKFIGNKEIGSGAHFAPGASPGTAEIQGNLSLEPGSVLELEIAGTTPGTGHDVVHTTGPLSVLGSVSVRFIDGFAPAAGQIFTLVRSDGALTWAPSQITVTGLAAGHSYALQPDGAGNVVFTSLNAGTAASQPLLAIELVPAGVELSWSAATGWILEEDGPLGTLTGWHPVTPAPTAEEGFFRVQRTTTTATHTFFRLHKP